MSSAPKIKHRRRLYPWRSNRRCNALRLTSAVVEPLHAVTGFCNQKPLWVRGCGKTCDLVSAYLPGFSSIGVSVFVNPAGTSNSDAGVDRFSTFVTTVVVDPIMLMSVSTGNPSICW